MSSSEEGKHLSSSTKKFSRRTFLKLSALAGAAATASCAIKRTEISAVVSAGQTAGKSISEKWIATSCLNCPGRCATLVRVVDSRAVKLKGNPLSLVSEGKTCPRAHIGLQVLYDAERLKSPLKRTNPAKGRAIDPQWQPISWEQALQEVSERLRSLRDNGQPHQLLILQGLNTVSAQDVLSRFADVYGTPNLYGQEGLLDSQAEKLGQWLADGNHTESAYDLEHTNYILSFGADILESSKPLARQLRLWGKLRRERPTRAKVTVISPRYSVTADRADEWIPINPGTHGALAMAIANVIIDQRLYDANFIDKWAVGFEQYKSLVLRDYTPEKVAATSGVPADIIRRIAREFAQTKPAIAWRGREATAWANGSYSSYAIFCLNALVGSIDVPGGLIYQEYPQYKDMPKPIEDRVAREGQAKPRLDQAKTNQFPAAEVVINQIPESLLQNIPYPVAMAMGVNSNFNMSATGAGKWDEAMAKLPYYVHVAPFASEMAQYADIVLPASTFLEEWAYDHSPAGAGFAEARIKQPVVGAWRQTKSVTDIIFEIASRLGGSVAQSMSNIGDDAEGFVRYRTQSLMPWEELKQKGVWVGPAYRYGKYTSIFHTPSRKFEFYSGNLEALLSRLKLPSTTEMNYLPHYEDAQFLGDKGSYPLILAPYQPVLTIENGSQNYPWAQEIFLVMHGIGWNNLVEINHHTAEALGIRNGDLVWVESSIGKLKAKAKLSEGIHPQVVAIAIGQGHSAYGRWQKNTGANPNEIIGVDFDRLSGQSALFHTRVRVYKA